MDMVLEQDLAAIVRYIQDNAEEGTRLYFDEIPEDFYVPSVYFQVPFTAGRKVTLRSFSVTMTMNIWFMASADWDAYAKVADMRDCIMLDNCVIPVVDKAGNETGRALRVTPPGTRRIDEGIVQLSFSFDTYFHPGGGKTKMQKFYTAWRNVRQMYDG